MPHCGKYYPGKILKRIKRLYNLVGNSEIDPTLI